MTEWNEKIRFVETDDYPHVSEQIEIDYSRNELLGEQGEALLSGFYLKDGENPQEGYARAAIALSFGDMELAQRLYDAASKHHLVFASPILSNSPRGHWVDGEWHGEPWKALPISCFGMYVPDTIDGQIDVQRRVAYYSVKGGGIGLHNAIRAPGGKAPGPIPYMNVCDSYIGYYRQGSQRRGSMAYYMDMSHPDIIEFINYKKPGGDRARKVINFDKFHLGVIVTREFERAVIMDEPWDLVCPHSGRVYETVRAVDLWEKLIEMRALKGEPYILFIDRVNDALNPAQIEKGLRVNGSNLCIEIVQPTNEERDFICCLSSPNAAYFDEWHPTMIQDMVEMLDNATQIFINFAPREMGPAVYGAACERSIGIGCMGFATYLQKKKIPFESGGFNSSVQMNNIIFSYIKKQAVVASQRLAEERGEPSDLIGTGMRNAHLLAIAPNANSSIPTGCSPSIEPLASNAYMHRTRAGSHFIKNPQLEEVLEKMGQNTAEVWTSIMRNDGSVQHLDFMDEHMKSVFKTAYEIDQHKLVQLAGQRQEFVCQSQSLNLFFPPNTERSYVNSVHLMALVEGKVKSLYYMRTQPKKKADTVKEDANVDKLQMWTDDVCIACEG